MLFREDDTASLSWVRFEVGNNEQWEGGCIYFVFGFFVRHDTYLFLCFA